MTILQVGKKHLGFTSFNLTDVQLQNDLYESMTTADMLANFSEKKQGFFHVEKIEDSVIQCEFLALNNKEISTIYDQGLTTTEVTLAETAKLIIFCTEKLVLASGAEGAIKPALYHLANCASIECKVNKPKQLALSALLDNALKIWSVKYTNIKNSDVKEVAFRGAFDDRFPIGDINESEISSCEMSLDTQYGPRVIRISKEGKVLIKKDSKQPFTAELVVLVLKQILA
jgi:hypothetical protein